MSSRTHIFDPLKRAFTAVFRQDLALKRDAGGVRLVLEDRPPPAADARPLNRAQATARKDDHLLTLAREQLAGVLDATLETRQKLRHLAFVEHALGKKGWRALHKVPLPMLQAALEQLDGQVTNWSPEGLAGLRSKMAVAVIAREQQGAEAEAGTYHAESVLDPPELLEAQALESAQEACDADAALLAAYAAMGATAPAVEIQGELGSASARAGAASPGRPQPAHASAADIRLRDVQP